jgi:putative sterol carrier protein
VGFPDVGYSPRVPAANPRCLDELAEWLRVHFDPKASGDLTAVALLDLRGTGGGSLVLRFEPGRAEIGSGTVADPDVLLQVDAGDFYSMLSGTTSPDVLHMQGRLEVEGNLGVAMKLRSLFPAR